MRFEIACFEADAAGFNVPNVQILTVMLFRALGVGASRARHLLHSEASWGTHGVEASARPRPRWLKRPAAQI
eukprot:5692813-Pyramimonas_sp.AAC.1